MLEHIGTMLEPIETGNSVPEGAGPSWMDEAHLGTLMLGPGPTRGPPYQVQISIDFRQVNCLGNETRLDQCSFLNWGEHDARQRDVSHTASSRYSGTCCLGYVSSFTPRGWVELLDEKE